MMQVGNISVCVGIFEIEYNDYEYVTYDASMAGFRL